MYKVSDNNLRVTARVSKNSKDIMSGEGSDAPLQTTEANDRNAQNRNQGRSRSNRRVNNRTVLSSPINFEGETSEIGVVIGLRIEKFHKKAGYQFFVEKVGNYVVKKLTDGADIKMLITEGKDPVRVYEENNLPKGLSESEKDDPVRDAILKEEIKQFVSRKNNIRRNIQTTFGLV